MLGTTGITSVASASTFTNIYYNYNSKTDGDYNQSTWQSKKYSGSNTPNGYVYAISSDGADSSILVRKKDSSGNISNCSSGYVTVPHMVHTCIRNNFDATRQNSVCIRVRNNKNSGTTRGYWSPDCSKKYGNIVG